jgi:Asp-tRNA(Asn)/Glu-tRNA(Gln) amidotransferase A subunit family amidase
MTSQTLEIKSHAFVEEFPLSLKTSGPLNGLTFGVKDLIDVAGHITGCGNPSWMEEHPPAACHAMCVDQLLYAGAKCIGKTVTSQLAFDLIGENVFFPTPLNPKAPDRVPGGSSSGSASAVACGLADFALGTDTGGSVRALSKRELYFDRLQAFLRDDHLICIPTTQTVAPLKGSIGYDRSADNYYHRVISLNSIAGIGRLPQVTIPCVEVEGKPLGLSFLAAHRKDLFLLQALNNLVIPLM